MLTTRTSTRCSQHILSHTTLHTHPFHTHPPHTHSPHTPLSPHSLTHHSHALSLTLLTLLTHHSATHSPSRNHSPAHSPHIPLCHTLSHTLPSHTTFPHTPHTQMYLARLFPVWLLDWMLWKSLLDARNTYLKTKAKQK